MTSYPFFCSWILVYLIILWKIFYRHYNKYWYISVGVEQEEIKEDLTDISLGVDLGLKNLAICSNGTVYKNINKTYAVRKIERLIHAFKSLSIDNPQLQL